MALGHLDFRYLAPSTETINFYCFKPPSLQPCDGSPSQLLYLPPSLALDSPCGQQPGILLWSGAPHLPASPIHVPSETQGLGTNLVLLLPRTSVQPSESDSGTTGKQGSGALPGRPVGTRHRAAPVGLGLPASALDLLPLQARRMTIKAIPLPACVTPEIMVLAR